MSAEETLEQIKSLLFDKDLLGNAKRIELLETLYDRVSLYHFSMKGYEALFDYLEKEGAITKFPADWKIGEIGEAFSRAARAEQDMFAVLAEINRLKEEGKA